MRLLYDVVGCGAVVQQSHAPVLRQLAREGAIGIHACLDLDVEVARTTARLLGAARYGRPDDVPPAGEVGAAIIATPPESHTHAAHKYLRSGKHVFIEKPLAVSLAEARELIELSRECNGKLVANQFRRFFPSVLTARRFVASGGLGRVSKVVASEGARWSWPSSSEYVTRSPYGGVIYDTGSHLLDMVLFILSLDGQGAQPTWTLRKVTRWPGEEPSHECFASMVLSLPTGGDVELELRLSRREPLPCAVRIFGECGQVLVIPTVPQQAPTLYVGGEAFTLRAVTGASQPVDALGCFFLAHQEFRKAIKAPSYFSLIDAPRFLVLVALLDALTHTEADRAHA